MILLVKRIAYFSKTNKKQMEYADSNDNLKTGIFFISHFFLICFLISAFLGSCP